MNRESRVMGWFRSEPNRSVRADAVLAALILLLGVSHNGLGAVENTTLPSAPNVDVRWDMVGEQPAAGARNLGAGLETGGDSQSTVVIGGMTVTVDPLFGTPNYVRIPGHLLKFGEGVGSAAAEQTVRNFIDANPALFGVPSSTLDEARVIRDAVSPGTGMRSLQILQTANGLDVFNAQLRTAVTGTGQLAFVSSGLLALDEVPGPAPVVRASTALVTAAREVGMTITSAPPVLEVSPAADQEQVFAKAGQFRFEPTARLIYFPLPGGEVRLAWWVLICPLDRGYFANVVDAITGTILLRQDMTVYDSTQTATYRAFAGNTNGPFYILDSPTPGSPKPPPNVPNQFQPGTPVGQPAVIALKRLSESANPQPSPDGWLDDGRTSFAAGNGNNVDVFVDRNLDDIQDVSWPVAVDRNFATVIDPPNLGGAPLGYRNFSMMQLFYTMNFCHDRFYMLGFDEAHGNFQRNNFGRGGVGGDAVTAVTQYGADFLQFGFSNNAFFSAPGDGRPGFLGSLVWTGPNPDRDASLDAEVMVHEYAHGVTNRLVDSAFGVGLFALQGGGLGEGWSDYFGLSLLAEPGDDVDGVYGSAGYVSLNLAGADYQDNYYFGDRRYPYSTDMAKNPLTYADIDPTQFSVPANAAVPRSPVWDAAGGFNPIFADEVHNQGEIWCSMLWECRANLIKKFGFAGNELMMQLVTDGLKLTPPNPTFIDARDAIFLADRIRTGGANLAELALGFTKRGLGGTASSPSAETTVGVVESFEFPRPKVALRATVSSGRAPLPVSFHAAVAGVLSDSALVNWDFGDGSTAEGGLHVTHVYSGPGSFVVRFVATFLPGFAEGVASAEATVSVEVSEDINTSPTARIVADIGEGDAPVSAIFRSSGSDPDGRIILHEWSFGDGGFATGEIVLHNYQNNGTFLVRLTVTDDRGGKDFAVRTITIGSGDNAQSTDGNSLAQPNPTNTSVLPSMCGAVGLVSLALTISGLAVLRLGRFRRARDPVQ